jgi:ribosome-associated protein
MVGLKRGPTYGGRVLSDQFAASVQSARTPVVSEFRDGDQPRSQALGQARISASTQALHSLVIDSLDEDGALDIVSISLVGKSSEADIMVVASGRSTRHVASIADKLIERLKRDGGVVPRAEGKTTADWVLIDAGDVIVHVFRPEVREFYQLEKMWMAAPDATARPASSPAAI